MSVIKNSYETVLVFSLKSGDEAVSTLIQKFKELIEKNAILKSTDEWGRRKFAYPINKENEGFYVFFSFDSAPEFPAELDRIYKITDGVVRSLIVKKNDSKEVSECSTL